MADLRCSYCSLYLFNSPVQCSCGDRLCGDCYNTLEPSKKATLKCPKCAEEISLDECFKDKAAENELKTATIKCTNQGCPWQGPGWFYMEHNASCKFQKIPWSNKQYGCTKLLLQSQQEHLESETRVEYSDNTQFDLEPQGQSANEDHQQSSPSQPAQVFLCPIPILESVTGPGAGLLSFGTVIEPDALHKDDYSSYN